MADPVHQSTPPSGWPQPDGTILAALDAAMMRTAEQFPWAAKVMAAVDGLPDSIRVQLEANLCNQLGRALHAAREASDAR